MAKSKSKLTFKKKTKDIFDEPIMEEKRIPIKQVKDDSHKNIMLSMLKGTLLTYSVKVESSYELLLCGLEDKDDLEPLIELSNSNEKSVISKVIENVNSLLTNDDVPLDFIEPEDIESSFGSINKENNRMEVKILWERQDLWS